MGNVQVKVTIEARALGDAAPVTASYTVEGDSPAEAADEAYWRCRLSLIAEACMNAARKRGQPTQPVVDQFSKLDWRQVRQRYQQTQETEARGGATAAGMPTEVTV